MFGKNDSYVWLGYADASYIASRLLWFTKFPLEAPVNAHRTIELYLKAFLVGNKEVVSRGSPAWGHKIGDLCMQAAKFDSTFSNQDLVRRVRYFERYFDFVRYPSDDSGPNDGSLTWFSFDSNILPLDEVVAFIRPRIVLTTGDWSSTKISSLLSNRDEAQPHQLRALEDTNPLLDLINTSSTHRSIVEFNSAFLFDQPGC